MIERNNSSSFSSDSDRAIQSRTRNIVPHVRAGSAAASAPGATTESFAVLVWRDRWLVLICVVVCLLAGAFYIRKAPPLYVSTARLYLDYVSISPETTESGRLPQTDSYLQTQAGLLKSRPVIAGAIRSLEPEQLRTFRDVSSPASFVHEHVTVEVGKKDQIISLSFRSPYPAEAARIVNGIVEAYMLSRSEHEQRNATQVLKILQEEMILAKGELAQKQDGLEKFRMNDMHLVMGSDQGGAVLQQYLDLQATHTRAKATAMEAEVFRKGVVALADDPLALRRYVQGRTNGVAASDATVQRNSLEVRSVELDAMEHGLSTKLTPDHPSVVSIVSEAKQAADKLAELDRLFVKATLASAEQEEIRARECEQQLAQMCTEQQKQVTQANLEIARYQTLRSEVETLTRYTETLEQQVRDIRKIVGEDIGRIRMAVLEPALAATNPSQPQKSKIMIVAAMMGLLLGGGLVVARGMLDQTLRSTDEISEVLDLPVLGKVPAMPRSTTLGQEVLLRPESHMAEAFRSVRTAIFFGAPEETAKTLLFTSPEAGDGKSTLVSNLAITMASAGQRTIIVDADLRKPSQHLIFGTNHQERSLSGVLERKTRLREAIQPSPVARLSLLTCGHEFASPAEALNSRRFALILQRLAEAYDRVLIDAPPVSKVADARIIGAVCDFTVLVLRADKTTKKMARSAIESLHSVGARMLGVVINDVRGSNGGYEYFGWCRSLYGGNSSKKSGRRSRPADESLTIVGSPSGGEG
jgi:polysaccharide biosynthesis transport protein